MSRTITRVPRSDKDWIYTASGRKFWPLDPRPEEIDIADIAHALANICRFNGHCRPFYSVAEHSVRVSQQAELRARGKGLDLKGAREMALWGLLHDASEAYLCDLTRPMKGSWQLGRTYAGFEAGLTQTIAERFGLPGRIPMDVHWADEILLATEFRDLMPGCEMPERVRQVAPLPNRILPVPSLEAGHLFVSAFTRLTKGDD